MFPDFQLNLLYDGIMLPRVQKTQKDQKTDKKEEIDPLELQKEILKARKRYLKVAMELDALIEELEGIKQPKKEDCSISLF